MGLAVYIGLYTNVYPETRIHCHDIALAWRVTYMQLQIKPFCGRMIPDVYQIAIHRK